MSSDFKKFVEERLNEASLRRKKYIDSGLQAFRLISDFELELPLSIDLYLKNAVISLRDEEFPLDELKIIEQVLKDKFGILDFFYKKRFRKEKGSFNENENQEIVIEENGCKFLINLSNYLDTGLFLDHREARKMVGSRAQGKVVANLFAYTGSFSVYAWKGGATFTHTVDLSKVYLDWAKRNFELNEMPLEKNWTYKMDALEFLKYAVRKELRFDFVVIDPPTFSKNKGENFSVQRDHAALILGAAEVLNEGGEIFFSTNFLEFRMDYQIFEKFTVRECSMETLPLDFTATNEVDELGEETEPKQIDNRKKIHKSFWLKPKN